MKALAFPAAIGLVISLATVTPASNDKKDERSSGRVERSMPVDAHATITVCVMSGAIEVRGWEKNEVYARSSDAEAIEFRRIDRVKEKVDKSKDKSAQQQVIPPATRVDVMVSDGSDKSAQADCQAVADVELKVPQGATVQVQTRDGDIHIVGVASAYAGSQNGDIAIERATTLVEAGSVGGCISLRDSSGRINLSSAGGAVEAVNIKSLSSDDTFEVGTVSGDIQLDHVSNTRLVAKTVNGAVNMSGALARSGQYAFTTMSGDVMLHLPTDASFQIVAKLSDNRDIVSDFPLKFSQTAPPAAPAASGRATPMPAPAPRTPPAQAPPSTKDDTVRTRVVVKPVVVVPYSLRRISATYGTGDAMISVASFSGTVHLKKM